MRVQRALMQSTWHKSNPDSLVSLAQPLSYADRLRIRQPGDAAFALGPHQDGGSVERWMPEGYGRGGTYDAVLAGDGEARFDPWDASTRVDAVNDLYDGLGACSAFRMFQGWLSMSAVGPREGTLLVNPLLKLATSYSLLRPFFRPRRLVDLEVAKAGSEDREMFLAPENWEFTAGDHMTSEIPGATPGYGMEFPKLAMHPHLELDRTMVHIPPVKPGDFVAWHCDSKYKDVLVDNMTEWLTKRIQQFMPWTLSTRERETRVCYTFLSVPSPRSMPSTWRECEKRGGRERPAPTSPVAKASPSMSTVPQRSS